MQLKPNTELQGGKYRIERVLGQGGFGITYLAEHTMLDKKVAIKEFFPKEYCDRNETTSHVIIGTKNSVDLVSQLKSKFVKEAKNISKLHNANIITIHDIFEENDTAYYVMEYVDGVSLAQMIKNEGALDEVTAIGYFRKVAEAVGYMHSLSMNHLDLKPANIMVRKADDEPVLIDFGLSKQYDASGGQTSTTPVGISHGFAPIEQYRPGGVATFTPQTDIYALGATLYNLLSGRIPPHYSELLEDGLPELPVTVSAKVCSAVEHAMEVKKNKRPASVEEFLSELAQWDTYALDRVKSKYEFNTQEKLQALSVEEETVFIESVGKENKSLVTDADASLIGVKESVKIENIEFVDLGLSVRWANMNIGANRDFDAGHFFSKRQDGNLNEVYQWNANGAVVPTIGQFEELLKRCKWYWDDSEGTMSYIIVGPNGNSIRMPVTGDGLKYPGINMVTFGLYWTNEALLNEFRAESLLLYFNHSTHCLSPYSTNKICPIRLVLK